MDDMTDFQKKYLAMLEDEEKHELEENADLISSFASLMKKKGLDLKNENFKYLRTIGIVAEYPNIITYLHPKLTHDKEGLLNFKEVSQIFERKPFLEGYLYGENFMLMANSYFRRGFHDANNYAPRFIELFWGLDDQNIESYISLDADRVRINVNELAYMERDTWYGARFDKNLELVPDGIVKLKSPEEIDSFQNSFFFASSYALDIKWSTKGRIKSFQAEEFKTEDIKIVKDGIEYHPVRYVHAEFDLDKKYFRHFDGAIHFYTPLEYYNRRDSDFNYNNKGNSHIKTLSQKLYKMNGRINTDTWIEFTSHFLTGNPLVFEYFEGKFPPHIIELLERLKQRIN